MHAIDMLYAEHLARRQLPSRDVIEPHTRSLTDERVARAVAGRLACALPSAEALDYLARHVRPPVLTVAEGTGFWAHCLRQVLGIEPVATDLFAPEDNPRFRRRGWHPVQPMDALEALRRYPDHDMVAACLPPGLSLQQLYEASAQATSRQFFVAGYFSSEAFGGGQEGSMSEAHGLRFRRVDCIARWGLEAPGYQTVLIHIWREEGRFACRETMRGEGFTPRARAAIRGRGDRENSSPNRAAPRAGGRSSRRSSSPSRSGRRG
jgi:hypothetical protein